MPLQRALWRGGCRRPSKPAGPVPPPPPSVLRVASEDGRKSYILRLRGDATIGEVRAYLDAHRGGSEGSGRSESAAARRRYQLRSAFPPRVFDDPSQTLAEAGLAPSAALVLRPL
ncbi:MAG: hypothetical protein J3K34DRAFT_441466 [Monoraphidium minutum]|nr:MAG: hypothetical protein J3K34DRAFT_441466 [Monoraphidium minutum]